jgi:UDP-N-acetylmuramoyl-tripeptide--D-alanyl-D-alanine ligase
MSARPPLWTAAEIAAATGGRMSAPFAVQSVAFDSREVEAGGLFIALRGERTDGHRFIEAAAQAGASGFLTEREIGWPHVRVDDSFAALQALARAARSRMSGTVIGVTGSVGKTGTKEALRQAFERLMPGAVHASVKSYNNHTGVPLSLARMSAASRTGIFEMGMNHAGEIAALTRLVRPQVAVITWVGAAHIEFFADGEAGIARAKAEIFEGVEPGGTAIWPADNVHAPLLAQRARALGLRGLSFGFHAAADVRVLEADVGAEGTDLRADVAGHVLRCRIGTPGRHWVGNALAVLATVKATGGDLDAAAETLADAGDLAGRGARIALQLPDGVALLIDESYNANPVSMRAALAVLRDTPAGRRLAVLGAMRELGPQSDALHIALSDALQDAKVDAMALVGAEMQVLRMAGAVHLADAAAASDWVRAQLRAGDVLLVKGSNSVGLAAVVQAARALGEQQ